MPFVSSDAYSKLVLRAVELEDIELLKTYLADTKQVSSVRSPCRKKLILLDV
jgi:hypothetical protein